MFEIIQTAHAQEIIEIGGLTIDVSWWPYLFLVIKYFFILLTISFTAGIILILFRVSETVKIRIKEIVAEAMEDGKLSKTKTQRQWDLIKSNVESKNPDDYKNAVVLAEKLFNRVLKMANFSGDNIEEKLKKIPEGQLELKDEIIWSSKLKEKIINDPSFDVDHEEAKRAVNIFEKTL
ncbi:hypothetical protein KAK05_00430, partial [Candidatus Parcubacteria bacterium]|nr:hypothetical protein [Candidatus Parcubacteria bacterium]